MIYRATQLIEQEFIENNVHYEIEEHETVTSIHAGFTIKNGPGVMVHFISRDDDNDVGIHVYGLVNEIDADHRLKALEAISEVNNRFRYAKFVLDSDGDVNVRYDLPVCTPAEAVGPMCMEIFARLFNICEEGYRTILRAIL